MNVDGIAGLHRIVLARYAKPWPSPQSSTGYSIFEWPKSRYGPVTGLLSSAPDFGRDGGNLDHRRPRRGGAIRQSSAGGTCAPLGADAEAARPGARRSRRIAGYRALYAARGEFGRTAGDQVPRPRPALPVDPRAGPAPVPGLSGRRDHP